MHLNDDDGLINVTISVYNGEPILDAYKAIAVTQLINNSTTAATMKLDRNYLIVSRREGGYAEINKEDYLPCPGTPQLKFCTNLVAFVSAQDHLCLTALLYEFELAALKTCVREVTEWPILTTAVCLGKSITFLYASDEQQFLCKITYLDG